MYSTEVAPKVLRGPTGTLEWDTGAFALAGALEWKSRLYLIGFTGTLAHLRLQVRLSGCACMCAWAVALAGALERNSGNTWLNLQAHLCICACRCAWAESQLHLIGFTGTLVHLYLQVRLSGLTATLMQGCSPRGLRWCLCFRPSMFTNHNFFGSFSPQCLQTTISLFLSALNVCLQIFWFFRPSMFINHNFFGSFSPQCLQTTISLFLSALHVYKPQFPYFFRPSMFATLLVLLAIDVCKPFGLLAIDVCKPSGSFGHQCLQTFWFFWPSMSANNFLLAWLARQVTPSY